MTIFQCKIPQIDVNDKKIVVSNFRVSNGDYVRKSDVILSIETAKAVSDFYTEETGFLAFNVEEFDELTIGETVALIFDNQQEAFDYAKKVSISKNHALPQYKATMKAEKLAAQLNIDLCLIVKNGIIKESDVAAYATSVGIEL